MSNQLRATKQCWSDMKQRCTNPNATQWKNYGARGITFCDRWKSFDAFLEDMGLKPDGYTIERVDNERGYSKDNCEWATPFEQRQNQRGNAMITFNGETLALETWGKRLGIHPTTLRSRYWHGVRGDALFNQPRSYSKRAAMKATNQGET